jgi:hypothetical protein
MKNEDKITQLYLAALARKPSKQELGVAEAVIKLHRGDMIAALQDTWWVLLNANEFILNH